MASLSALPQATSKPTTRSVTKSVAKSLASDKKTYLKRKRKNDVCHVGLAGVCNKRNRGANSLKDKFYERCGWSLRPVLPKRSMDEIVKLVKWWNRCELPLFSSGPDQMAFFHLCEQFFVWETLQDIIEETVYARERVRKEWIDALPDQPDFLNALWSHWHEPRNAKSFQQALQMVIDFPWQMDVDFSHVFEHIGNEMQRAILERAWTFRSETNILDKLEIPICLCQSDGYVWFFTHIEWDLTRTIPGRCYAGRFCSPPETRFHVPFCWNKDGPYMAPVTYTDTKSDEPLDDQDDQDDQDVQDDQDDASDDDSYVQDTSHQYPISLVWPPWLAWYSWLLFQRNIVVFDTLPLPDELAALISCYSDSHEYHRYCCDIDFDEIVHFIETQFEGSLKGWLRTYFCTWYFLEHRCVLNHVD